MSPSAMKRRHSDRSRATGEDLSRRGSVSKRPGRFLLPILLVGLAALLFASLQRTGPDERAFRRAAGGGEVVRLKPGWHLVVPFMQQIVRLPDGALRVAGQVEVGSPDDVSLSVPFDVRAEIDDGAVKALLGRVDGRGGPGLEMRSVATVALTSWGMGRSGESIAMLDGGRELERTIRNELESRDFENVEVRIGRVIGPTELLVTLQEQALRERVVDTGTRIAIFGLDGADWEIIDPLIARGRLPNLARLKTRGAWGNMKTMTPTLSPLLWTTVATGKPPDRHGIIDFLVKDTRTGKPVPVSSRWRKVKALWNIFGDAGRDSAFIAWWATWPAEPVVGYMVSDRVAYSLFAYKSDDRDRAGATHPPGYFQVIQPSLVNDADITIADLKPFVSVTPDEFRALREKVREDPGTGYREPVNHLTKILASARSYQAVGLDILDRGQPDVFSIYYQGIDEVCHRFAHYMPPRMGMVSDADYARYSRTVEAYYRYQDHLLGEMLDKLDPDTTVIVLSDHGFKNGSGRPKNEPPYIEGKPGLWHRRYGIVIFMGPPIRPGRLDTTGLLDIAPTVLYLAGLPVAEDMSGRVVEEAIDPGFLARHPLRTLPSYERVGRPLHYGEEVVADSGVDDLVMEQLRALGYIGGEGGPAGGEGGAAEGALATRNPDGQSLITAHLNEASLHLQNKDYALAEAAVAEALKIAPDMVSGLILRAQIAAEQKQYARAIEDAQRVVAMDPEGERQIYSQLGRIFIDAGRLEEGLDYFRGLLRDHPGVGEIHSAVGTLLLKRGDNAAAEAELLEALRINPALGDPLTELHTLYRDTDRVLTLEEIVRKGLEINEKSVVHHNWMGLIYEWKRDLVRAEREFHRAMEIDPDYAATMANLGALYGRSRRLDEAVRILTRAVDKDPENLEAWINLGASRGRLHQAALAIEALETARRKGARTTTLFNALALAYWQNRQIEKAEEYIRESLLLDPNQEDARELQRAIADRPS